ncbi:low affinity immunoglobulin epsilon Fc receptor-like [Drosophila serrata]|uniref:low affinity immunoglobulin epsilon Fc receptor-like n=1 Tax=Drosophila serrata TaxID=7274 RepID=UPI000A1D02B9|nr:low affinity immunoglobulin epsilon Fc receptor-like [Drosophila serrata]
MKSQAVLFFAIIASFLYKSLAGPDDVSSTVCLLQDEPNQCGKFCLTALKPLIDHIALHQQQWNTRDAVMVNETQTKLNRIEGQLDALKDSLVKLLPKDLATKLETMKTQQSALDNKLLDLQKTFSKINRQMLLKNFNQIGNKHFYVEQYLKRNWTGAITTCGQMGGQLASIENESEFDAIVAKLKSDISYRVDINDLAEKGKFISKNSGKPAVFFKWKRGEPRYDNESQRCVTINGGGMWVDSCKNDMYFICEASYEE